MRDYCVGNGISYHLTVPYTPQLNGVSERMVRTITEKARSMINGAKLSKQFWGEAVLTATYLINRTPSNALKGNENKTPYEMWYNRKPDLKYLRIFGSTMYVLNKTKRNKFDEKSWKGILVGYCPNGYKLWDVEGQKFVTARDVIADETNMENTRPVAKFDKELGQGFDKENESKENETDELSSSEKASIEQVETCKSAEDAEATRNQSSTLDTSANKRQIEIEVRRSKRIKELPKISYEENDIYKCLMSSEIYINTTPNSYSEIKDRPDKGCWEKAIKEELDSHLCNNTWTIVLRPPNKNIVGCRWVFTRKCNELGNPNRYKARLVAKGFTQQHLEDYDETYAPVARITSLRVFLSFANQYNLLVHHMDVKTAFLNGILKEEIFMEIPEGLNYGHNQVCKLNKAIYGLKQSARCWFQVFEKAITEIGFKNSEVDRCIFILDKKDIKKNIYVLLYVDDLVIVTACSLTLNSFKAYLKTKFRMTDLGEIRHFIGIKIERENNKLMLSQTAYIKKLMIKFKMDECKPTKTPMPTKIDYEALNKNEDCNLPCRSLIGCLMYIMVCTRPDISVCINILSRYANKSNSELWKNLKRVLRYLQGTKDLKLVYEANNYNKVLIGYVDSDWGGSDSNDRKSTTGYLFKMFENSTVSWNTRKQLSVAASSTEAEYMALFEAVREALWLKALVKSICIEIKDHIIIKEDNQGCISIANNPACHKRTKHIDIKYHFTREQVENQTIKIEYISTDKQIADVLTKILPDAQFTKLRQEMGVM